MARGGESEGVDCSQKYNYDCRPAWSSVALQMLPFLCFGLHKYGVGIACGMARRNNETGLYGLDAVLHTACALRSTAEERILVTPLTNRSLARRATFASSSPPNSKPYVHTGKLGRWKHNELLKNRSSNKKSQCPSVVRSR